MKIKSLVLFIGIAIAMASCRKDVFNTDSSIKLNFSEDTLTFDTVFTSIGSATRYFKIYNRHNQKIKISDIRLAGGADSHFRMNVDGIATTEAKDVEIAANDSLYIFAAVTVDPNNLANPFVIEDSILFNTNGNNQRVILNAWGQNAHFIYDSVLHVSQTWINDLPYVIINSMLVDTSVTLTIDCGCRIYNHPGSRIYVAGTLKVNPTCCDSVVFQGDRLEQFFQDLPGRWQGIHFLRGSINNEINCATIKDAEIGVRVDSLPENNFPNLFLRKVKIKNMLYSGILGITAVIRGENLLVINCGQNNCFQNILGGDYQFNNCTFADYSNVAINHQEPAVYLSNYYAINNVVQSIVPCHAVFNNCIIWGGLDQELAVDFFGNDPISSDTFNSCCVKSDSTLAGTWFKSDPLFYDYATDNYRLTSTSPCKDSGMDIPSISTDIEGTTRPLGAYDIGAYEFH